MTKQEATNLVKQFDYKIAVVTSDRAVYLLDKKEEIERVITHANANKLDYEIFEETKADVTNTGEGEIQKPKKKK